MTDAYHDHLPTYTGPGHAVLLTGATPSRSGIVGNLWWDPVARKVQYCVEGPVPPGASRGPITPATLLVTTLADELELATGGRSKTWAFGLKDRAAVLLAGHAADRACWFDEVRGSWTSSAHWRGDDGAPDWLRELGRTLRPDADFGATWAPSVPAEAFERLWVPPGAEPLRPFAHTLDVGAPAGASGDPKAQTAFHAAWVVTPFANDWVLRSALACVRAEALGADDVPDLLAVNLSTNDYVGHRFGPDSAEVLDVTVRTDRQLAAFFRGLAEAVPGGLDRVVVALSSDHGVASNAVLLGKAGIPSGLHADDDTTGGTSRLRAAAESALDAAFGAGDWMDAHVEHQLWFSRAAIARRTPAERDAMERVAADACRALDGVHDAYGRTAISEGRIPRTAVARAVALGFHPERSGDVVIVTDPGWTPARTRTGATHGAPWTYDAKVPLVLRGPGIVPGRHRARAATTDLAPTLADLLGISPPSGSEGRVLAEALR